MSSNPYPSRAPWHFLLVLTVLALILSACASAAPPATQAPAQPATQAAPTAQEAPAQQADPTDPAAPADQTAPTQPPAAAAPTEPPAQAAQPVISTDFTPSDPAQVSLAAGRPQLVEFFAFW